MTLRENWTSFATIVVAEMRRVIRIWPQTLLPSAVMLILYFTIFGHIIGPRVGKMAGYDYVKFIAPGLIMMTMITSAYSATVSAFFGAKFGRFIEELLVSPTPNWVIILGYVTGGMVRGIIVGSIAIIITILFTHIHVHSLAVIVAVTLLSTAIFSLAGLINAVFARRFDDITIIPTFVLTPLVYLGGVFYSVKLLPGIWHALTLVNPVFYIINIHRYGFLGISDASIATSFIMMGLFIVLLYGVAYYLISKGIGLKD